MHLNEYYISFFDILIIIPLGWAIYKGFINGFIVESISLATLLLGTYFYIRIVDMPGRIVSKEVAENLEYIPLALFTVCFIVIVFLSNAVERIIGRITDDVALPPYNRALGVVFSVIKYVVIISGFLIFFDKLDEKYNMLSAEDTDQSIFYSHFIKVVPAIYPYLNFDNIKNRRYIVLVQQANVITKEGRIPIGESIRELTGIAGKVDWTSYQSPFYSDNHDLIIVEASVENQDSKILKTAVFQFLLKKRNKEVTLYGYILNGQKMSKALAIKALRNGKL
jgi:membrane protein required for colicin V production